MGYLPDCHTLWPTADNRCPVLPQISNILICPVRPYAPVKQRTVPKPKYQSVLYCSLVSKISDKPSITLVDQISLFSCKSLEKTVEESQNLWGILCHKYWTPEDFPGGPTDKNLPANAGDTGLIHVHTDVWKEVCGRKDVWKEGCMMDDSTHHGAAKVVCHSYLTCILYTLKPTCLEPMPCKKRSHCNEKTMHCN